MLLLLAQQANNAAPASPAAGFGGMLIPMLLVFAVFYFLMVRPQQKQQKQFQSMLAALQRGDDIVTRSGIHGKVLALENGTVQVEIAKNVQIKMNKDQIAAVKKSTTEPVAANG